MKQRSAKAILLSLVTSGLLAASMNVNARAIRIDDDDGTGLWTFPVESGGPSLFVGDIGFAFNFFGTTTTSMTINSNGSVSFGGAVIAPFLDGTQLNTYSYSTTRDNQEPTPGVPSAIRVQWGDGSDANFFQLAIFDLTNDVFAMEFNYAQITAGSDATSSIGYDNGAGTSIDLLADLGNVLGLGGPLAFGDYMGIGADGLDANDEFLDPDNLFCDVPGRVLACNNYNAVTGVFGPGAGLLSSDFGGYFQVDPSLGEDAQGRYFFLIDNRDVVPVPEPGTLSLLGIGLGALAMIRRRRMAGNYRP